MTVHPTITQALRNLESTLDAFPHLTDEQPVIPSNVAFLEAEGRGSDAIQVRIYGADGYPRFVAVFSDQFIAQDVADSINKAFRSYARGAR